MTIRPASLDDLDALDSLEKKVFSSDRLSRRSLRDYIKSEKVRLLVLETSAGLAGYALVAFRKGSDLARLYSIAVDPALRRKGMGQSLLDACEKAARERSCRGLRLEVHIDNTAAIDLYERNGYRRFAKLEDYYEDGAAALRFEKSLTASRDPS